MADEEFLYSFYIDAWVKSFKGQRQATAIHVTPTYHMLCNNVVEFKEKLWSQYSSFVKGKAIIPMNLVDMCSVEEDSNVIENIDSFLFFKKSNREITLNYTFTSRNLQNFSTPGENGLATIDLTIFSYSESITSSDNWTRFNKDCIQPVQADRGGASNEDSIRAIIFRLKDRWRGLYIIIHL